MNEGCPKCGYTLNVFGACLRCDTAALAKKEAEIEKLKQWEILWFAKKMREALLYNSRRGKWGWDGMDNDEILERIDEEVAELTEACHQEKDITKEAIDVANFCLFIAWNNREQALKEKDG